MDDTPNGNPQLSSLNIDVEDDLDLSNLERQTLQLYDQLREVTLEYHYLQVLQESPLAASDATTLTVEDIEAARLELLDAKARYTLRNNIEESILTVNPIIQAVHNHENPSLISRDLLTLVQTRDKLSLNQTCISAEVEAARKALLELQVEHAEITRHSVEQARAMIDLAHDLDDVRMGEIDDQDVKQQVKGLEADVRLSRQRWKLMKGVVSGLVAGSGVNWAGDEKLQNLVLDEEDSSDD